MLGTSLIDPRRRQLAADSYRPGYHYLAPANWMNDPNGTIFWKGRYHVFYQYNPDGAFHGNIHWGHASSADLVHWDDHPIALAPTAGGPDCDHCYSGAAFVNRDGIPTFIYHGVPDGICLATSHDDMLVHWEKHPANPIIPNPGPTDEFRIGGAPCAWVEDGNYYALTGNSHDKPDTAYLYTSSDMAHWEYLHPFYQGGFFTEGAHEDCGCPDFFALGDKHMLLFTSHSRGAQCYIGTYSDHRFVPERHIRFAFGDWGRPGIYAEGLTMCDEAGRRILFGRLSEARYGHIQRASGWAGMLSLPTILSLADDGNLQIEPAQELAVLRQNHISLTDISIAADAVLPIDPVAGDMLEIRAVFLWEDAEEFGIKVRCSPDGEEQTLIRFNANPTVRHRLYQGALSPNDIPSRRNLILDVTRSSVSAEVSDRESQRCAVTLAYGEPLELRVFVDRSVVEVFANSRHYLSKRIYPARPDSLGLQVFAVGGRATLLSLEVWHMEPIWPVK